MLKVSYSAPGKVILSGEHSVVYGKKAIAMAIDLRTYCQVETFHTDSSIFLFVDIQDNGEYFYDKQELGSSSQPDPSQLREVLKFMYQHIITFFKQPFEEKIKISISSEIPIAKGLGSSASFVVSFCGSLLTYLSEYLKEPLEDFLGKVTECAHTFESIFHGNPSGIDHNTSLYGNCIIYQKHEPIQVIQT